METNKTRRESKGGRMSITDDDDALLKVMAELYMDNESHECFVFDKGLKFKIALAQVIFNINGGERPAAVFVENIKKYCNDIENNAQWHQQFKAKYFERSKY